MSCRILESTPLDPSQDYYRAALLLHAVLLSSSHFLYSSPACLSHTAPRSQQRLPIPTSGPLIGSTVVSPSATVRDLGVFIDQDLATDSVPLLCHLASVAKHSSLHTDVRLPFPCFGTRPQQVGLLQQSPGRLASHSHPASPVSPKCRSKAHFQPETLWPHHRRAHQPSLAPIQIIFKMATLIYSVLYGSAPPYLASSFTCVADMPHRRSRAFQFGQKKFRFDSIRFSLSNRFFRFDSIRQSDKFAAYTLVFK